jgi:glycosyltransferase involved in cell wall biosynthesis
VRWFLRIVDKRGANRPDVLVANSKNVAKRIESYYGRKSIIIYPPVEVPTFKDKEKKGSEYYVWVSRLVRQKGADLAIGACNNLKKKLVIIGDGDERESLKKVSGKTIEFKGACDDDKKFRIIKGAKALIYTSVDEDFGIVPVEALKLGVPVVAFNSGGVREAVDDGKTGVLYSDYSIEGLSSALLELDKIKINKQNCLNKGSLFGKKIFENKIRELVVKGYDRKNK